MDEQRISVCKSVISQIATGLHSASSDWEAYIPAARGAIASLDLTSLMSDPRRHEEQAWIIENLQKLAYSDPDSGGVRDIADWCLNKWLVVMQNHPDNVRTLRGIGHWWLQKAQPCLARIHAIDGSSSSSGGSGLGGHGLALTRSEEERELEEDEEEAEARAHTSDYVEARGYLAPATEYLARAVQWAHHQGSLNGELLSLAAEAYISVGNVSSPSSNEQHFRQAIGYLRSADAISDYTLCSALQSFYDDYGRLV